MNKIAIVTGGSSGIGLASVCALRARGCTVYEFSRHGKPGDAYHVDCDVSDEQQFRAAVAHVAEKEGRIDILVNNAGFGISGAAEFTENENAKRLLDVDLFGVVNGCRAVIPIMRAQGGGRIVNISSVAAPVSIPFQSWYSVAKAAVSSYTESLRSELYPFGITLTAILPGDIRTGFTSAREKSPVGDDIYSGRIARSVAVMEHDEQTGMAPTKAGQYIAKIACKPRVKPSYAVGLKYKFFAMIAKLLPARGKCFIVRQLYAK
jgi:NAD(P)-dependent dehydrogenase (short-subunit alcohol dehydrogenase family)